MFLELTSSEESVSHHSGEESTPEVDEDRSSTSHAETAGTSTRTRGTANLHVKLFATLVDSMIVATEIEQVPPPTSFP